MTSFSKKARQAVEMAFATALYTVLEALPADAASAAGGWLARTVGPRLRVSNVARRNLARVFPDKTGAEIDAIVGEVWENLGRVAGEFPHLDWLARNRVVVEGLDVLEGMRDDGKPGFFVSAHFGNWELGAAVGALAGLAITVVYRAANNASVNALYQRGRDKVAHGGQIAKGPEGARELLALIKNGGHVAMLIDQKMNDGIAVPFFGRDAMTPDALARFAQKFDCPIVPVRVLRLRGARFRMTFFPPVPQTDETGQPLSRPALMARLNSYLEDWIRENPGQWLWLHKRWPD